MSEKPLPSPDGTPISYYNKDDKPTPTPNDEALWVKPEEKHIPQPPRSPPPPRRPQPAKKPYIKGQPVKILTIIDVYGWAYDEGRKGLYKELRRLHPDWTLDAATAKQITDGEVNPSAYDVIFCWAWWNFQRDTMQIWHTLLGVLPNLKTVLCFAGEQVLKMIPEHRIYIKNFPYRAGNNTQTTKTLRKLFPHRTIFELPYGVDLPRFSYQPPPPAFAVGWAGNQNRPLKRFQLAEKACNLADVPLHVAGHVTTGKYVKPNDMPAWYHDKSVVLITSRSEVHPLIYYEALATGTPVLGTLVGDIESTAKNMENGVYVPINVTAEQLAAHLKMLRDSPSLIAQMGLQARRDVERRWSWGKVAGNYVDAVNEVLGAFSCCMLVCRSDSRLERALQSVAKYKPWELRCYIDPETTPHPEKAEEIIKRFGGKVFYQKVSDTDDHHDDVVRSVHRAISEAQYRRVLWVDDDDEATLDLEELLHTVGHGVGIVYGGCVVIYSGRKEKLYGLPVTDVQSFKNMKGSVVLYNRDAFRRIMPSLDVQNPKKGRNLDAYGYFWDYRIAYWLRRAGYRLKFHNSFFSNYYKWGGLSAKRQSLYNAWNRIVSGLEQTPLRLSDEPDDLESLSE